MPEETQNNPQQPSKIPRHENGFSFPGAFVRNAGTPPPKTPDLSAPVFTREVSRRSWRFFLFIVFLAVYGVTWFTESRFTTVEAIAPEVLLEPAQTPVADKTPIMFEKNGYRYTVTPQYEYDISGLVLHRLIYDSWFSISRTDSVFPIDLCMVWGDNVKNKVYQAPSLSVKQDFRFCLFSYQGDIGFRPEQLSNNHLVIAGPQIEKVARSILSGDQVRIRGKLADVVAEATGPIDDYESKKLQWSSSVSRTDTGAGACEVLYVEEIQVLRRGNLASRTLNIISVFGMAAVFVSGLVNFLLQLRRKPYQPTPPPATHGQSPPTS